MNRVIYLYTLIFFIVLGSASLNAQDSLSIEERQIAIQKANAKRHLDQLSEGVLLVRLETEHKSITAFESSLKSPNLKPKQRKLLEKQLEKKIAKRDRVNKDIRDIFSGGSYDFSEVVFIYDTSTHRILDGAREGFFFDKEGNPLPDYSVGDKDFYVAYLGSTNQASFSQFSAFVVCDRHMKPLDRPFPGYVMLQKGFVGELGKLSYDNLDVTVIRLNNLLHENFARSRKW